MKDKYLGDSYDVVKRLWQQALKDWAPLYANPDFIPIDLRTQFTKMTLIEMQPDEPETGGGRRESGKCGFPKFCLDSVQV